MISQEKLINTVADALEVSAQDIELDTKLEDIAGYDSLGALSIFSAISKETSGKSDEFDLTDAKTVREIFDLLEQKYE